MAKVKDPFGAREARGSVGGITATRNSSGQILRCKASPVQPRSAGQQHVRFALQKLTRAFQDLTPAQIANWNDFASNWPVTDVFGDSITITGMNWFVALNSRLETLGAAISSNPPLNPNCDNLATFTLFQSTIAPKSIHMTMTTSLATGDSIWLQWSSNLPKSSLFKKKSCKQRQIVEGPFFDTISLVPVADLSLGDSLRQFESFNVDDAGRGGPTQRWTIYPTA